MIESPLLSEADVRLEVERLFRRDQRSKLHAHYGRGQAGRFVHDGLPAETVAQSTVQLALNRRAAG